MIDVVKVSSEDLAVSRREGHLRRRHARLARQGELLGGAPRQRLAELDGTALQDLLRTATIIAGITCTRQDAEVPTRAEVTRYTSAGSARPEAVRETWAASAGTTLSEPASWLTAVSAWRSVGQAARATGSGKFRAHGRQGEWC
ncbi:hypothetical protein ACTMTI_31635 [Nonomuraea sp. H19]|uniref:hypothetical protein n=1 Tax=Nonomuraea sp. H19 TaxID=3452206 RepID=UPI003F8BF20E